MPSSQSVLTLLGALARVAYASPVPSITDSSHLYVHQPADFACFNASLPNVTIYATGGTIAGAAGKSDQTTGYKAGSIGIGALIDAVPQLCNISNVRGVQVANVGSTSITPQILVNISQQIQKDLDSGLTQGVVVTHGTDTLEETAFFLDLTVKSEQPVVVVGAMRPATAISADGPMNLLASVTLAASKSAMGRGTMVVLNDRIASARYVIKTNANMVDTFKAEEQGYLGAFENIKPVFYYPPARALGYHHFDISNSSADVGLPEVDILYGHQALQPGFVQAALDLGAKGLVLAGMGAGSWTTEGVKAAQKAFNETGLPIIDSARTPDGFVGSPNWGSWGIGGGFLNPQKCRIQLQLALEVGLGYNAIRSIFEYTGVGDS